MRRVDQLNEPDGRAVASRPPCATSVSMIAACVSVSVADYADGKLFFDFAGARKSARDSGCRGCAISDVMVRCCGERRIAGAGLAGGGRKRGEVALDG